MDEEFREANPFLQQMSLKDVYSHHNNFSLDGAPVTQRELQILSLIFDIKIFIIGDNDNEITILDASTDPLHVTTSSDPLSVLQNTEGKYIVLKSSKKVFDCCLKPDLNYDDLLRKLNLWTSSVIDEKYNNNLYHNMEDLLKIPFFNHHLGTVTSIQSRYRKLSMEQLRHEASLISLRASSSMAAAFYKKSKDPCRGPIPRPSLLAPISPYTADENDDIGDPMMQMMFIKISVPYQQKHY